jgi:hypothetical protein
MIPIIASCSQSPPSRYPIVSATDLLLTAASFPDTWEADSCEPYCERAERFGNAFRTFGRPNIAGHVIQQVTNYTYERSATAAFQRAQEVTFSQKAPQVEPFISSPSISYTSPIADDYNFSCGIDVIVACRTLARYGNYYIEIYFVIDDGDGNGLQLSKVPSILSALDIHIASVLGIEAANNIK